MPTAARTKYAFRTFGSAPLLFKLLPYHDMIRTTESGITWRHLNLTAAMLAENGFELRTMAHYMLRHAAGAFRSAP
jgi:hypothetical protein